MKDVCTCIIIGGGIAGLYMAMRLREHGIDDVVVIESEKTLGGRVKTTHFAHRQVVLGAGIGRAAKDVMLGRLMDQLDPRRTLYSPFEVQIQRAPTIPPKKYPSPDTIVRGKRIPHAPFGKLLREALGPREYSNFLDASLYTNFESDDATDVIRDYGMDDNEGGWTGWRIDWKRLVDLLKERVGRTRMVTGWRVKKILHEPEADPSFSLTSSSGDSVRCRLVVIATDIGTVRELLPDHAPLYRGIRGQPFIRVYATFDPAGSKIMASAVKTLTIVPRPLKKIIPIDPNPKKGLYMIAYSDNEDADRVRRVMNKKGVLSEMLQNALGLATKPRILRLRSHFWPIGTHAYLPLSPRFSSRTDFIRKAQSPQHGVYVVGELVSRQQGWVEGALQSVDRILPEVVRRVGRNNVPVQGTRHVGNKGITHGRIGSQKK